MESHSFAGPLEVDGVIRFTEERVEEQEQEEEKEESLFIRQHSSPAVKLNLDIWVSVRLSVSRNFFVLCVTGE